MRLAILVAVLLTICNSAPGRADDSYIQPQICLPVPMLLSGPRSARRLTMNVFILAGYAGVYVQRGEWDDFYAQCAAGRVPFRSGMAVDPVAPEHGDVSH